MDRPTAPEEAVTEPTEQWQAWVEKCCAALELDPALVDITEIHELSKNVAHEVQRPLAPVSTFILGLAIGARVGRGEPVDAAVRDDLVARVPLG